VTIGGQNFAAKIPEEHDGKRFDQALAAMFPDYSRARLQAWIKSGNALLDGAVVLPRAKVSSGQSVDLSVEIEPHDALAGAGAEAMPLDIVYEDADLIVVNKPAGLVVHPGAGNAAGTLMNGLLHYAPELEGLPRAGILHRLDKETTGLLLIARSLVAHTHLVRALEQRDIRREYRAVCNGRLTAGGTVDAPLGRHPTRRKRMAVHAEGKPAVTHYRVLARFPAHTFIALRLETGRTHQIRVHMAHRSYSLVGDPVYGGRLRIPTGADERLTAELRAFRRQALHASELAFVHPVSGESVSFHAPLPQDMLELLAALAGDEQQDFEALQWPR